MTLLDTDPLYPNETQKYWVVGFAHDGNRVALIKKNRPKWQEGLWNGVGGKVEFGENAQTAMQREFAEEAGLLLPAWKNFVTMTFPAGTIFFFVKPVLAFYLNNLQSLTDEYVEIHDYLRAVDMANRGETIPNLSWLLPLAVYRADDYETIEVKASHDSTV